MSLLGIDLGTSGVRAAAFSAAGELLAYHAIPTGLKRDGGRLEIDAEAVLVAVYEAVATVAASAAVLKDRVDAVSFSAMGEAVVPVDAEGNALAPAPVSMDRRGAHAASVIGDRLGHATYQGITGQPLHPMFGIFKVMGELPKWSASAVGYRTIEAFVAEHFGAVAAIDRSTAARVGAFDVQRLSWSDEILRSFETPDGLKVDPSALPKTVAAGTVIGTLSRRTAERLGVAQGIPIVAGLHDQAASFVGAGGRRGGPSVFALGSSECLTIGTAFRPHGLEGSGFASYPISDDMWITLAGTAAGGWALDWFAGMLGEPVSSIFDNPSEEPPALIVLPYLAGSGTLDNDPAASGLIAGLTLGTSRGELARAFLESTGFELAKIVDAFERNGVQVGSIRAVGTGAGNAAALRIRASAVGLPLSPVLGQTSARGAALVAGVGVGVFTGLGDLPPSEVGPVAEPESQYSAWYAQQRVNFRDLYANTVSTVHSLTHDKENHR